MAGLRQVEVLVAETAERYGVATPRILAVSKRQSEAAVQQAYDLGQRAFGENFAQDLVARAENFPDDVEWHMIGHVQTNKCKALLKVQNVRRIETVDGVKLADALNAGCASLGRQVEILIQVKTSLESTKTGLDAQTPKALSDLVRHILRNCPCLEFRGLMTIAHSDKALAGDCFDKMVELKREVVTDLANFAKEIRPVSGAASAVSADPTKCTAETEMRIAAAAEKLKDDFVLSMGMSADLDIAIAKGSTQVRIGTSIFGERLSRHQEIPPHLER